MWKRFQSVSGHLVLQKIKENVAKEFEMSRAEYVDGVAERMMQSTAAFEVMKNITSG